MEVEPLILTAKLDAVSFDRLDALRRRHFPPARNFLAAHGTIFHKLPGELLEKITRELAGLSAETDLIAVSFPSLRFLGRGVAVEIESPGLVALRRRLAELWAEHLSPQDRHRFRPHVTVQNKVDPATARELFTELQSSFELSNGSITGLELWHYAGGPWRFEREFPLGLTFNRDDSALRI